METSQAIGNLAKALSQAQGQFKPIKRESVNPFFKSKYADLSAIIDATREALSKNSLAVVQLVTVTDGESPKVNVTTILAHESGESIQGTLSLTPKANDPQAIGSATTYARRYGLGAMLGVASEDDDDANAATQPQKKAEARQPQVSNPEDPITMSQKNAINAILTKLGVSDEFARHEKVSGLLKLDKAITSFAVLTKAEASKVIEELGKM